MVWVGFFFSTRGKTDNSHIWMCLALSYIREQTLKMWLEVHNIKKAKKVL